MLVLRKKSDNVWKNHRDDRTAAELVAEALKLPTSQT
jgi:hypothetical protein